MSVIDSAEAVSAFQRLNHTRIERLSTLLPQKAHFFLKVLPLILQTNDPILPGYINQATPVGIVAYQPNNAVIDAAKIINHAFHYKRHSLHHYPLRGLYIINHNGQLNYHNNDEFDLWLVYAESMTSEQLRLLQQKITAICDWAYSSHQIKLNSRLLNEASLSDQITTSDVDRFYSNGLVLAGLFPSWWTTPPADQAKPINTLQSSPVLNNDTLDFGTITSREDSAKIVLTHALKTIDIAMDSDLEACLSLIFQKIQLQQYPNFSWMSDQLKQAIYAGVTDPMLLDSNYLKLSYINTVCTDSDTLFIAQQSFYIQCRERLTKTVNLALYPWRRTFIEALYQRWQWPPNTVEMIDKRVSSHYRQSLREYYDVRLQITNALQATFLFALRYVFNIEKDRQKLERKFKILFDDDLDAINGLPSSFKPKSAEEQLYLVRSSIANYWQINDLPSTLSTEPLYQHHSLLNVLAWAINNQLLTKATRIQFVDQLQKVKIGLVLDLIQQLLHSPIKTLADKIIGSNLDDSAEIDNVLLFANLELQTVNSLTQQGLELTSLQTDPLNYANSKQSLVASIEGLIHSSWGHWHYIIHTGPSALLELLSNIIQWQPRLQSALTTSCWCPSDNHGQKISQRIEDVYNDIIAHYVKHNLSGDYLITIAGRFYRLQWQQGLVDILSLSNKQSVEQHLAAARDIFSASKLDPVLDKDGLLQYFLNQQVENRINLFLLSKNKSITLYILDDLGILFKQQTSDLTAATLINHYQHFFSKMNIVSELAFFHLTHSMLSGWQSTKISNVNISTNKPAYLPVGVELDSLSENAHCIIHCGTKTFIGNLDDPSLFQQVRYLVLNLRNITSRYPLYINQLSITSDQHLTTRHFVLLKQKIERLLNEAENLSL